jgi:hypothetical protein
MPPPLTWQISHIIVDFFFQIIFVCILNQSHGNWLLSEVLHFAISMNLKLKEGNRVVLSFESFMGGDCDSVIIDELSLLAITLEER